MAGSTSDLAQAGAERFANRHRGAGFELLGAVGGCLFELAQSIFVVVRSRG